MKTDIYLDCNATTDTFPAAREAANRAMGDAYGNPSSTHSAGLRARAILHDTRARAWRLLGVGSGALMFNSGATEGIQTAVLSALCSLRERRARGERTGSILVYGATEHKAVPESLKHWNRVLGLDLEIRALPVNGCGMHDLAELRALAADAALVCTMAANNETGAVSDLEGIAAALSGSDALWLVDCVQALGKISLHLSSTRIDYAPFSGHKLYAPKGVGMLYVRAGAPFTPLMIGGGQENGMRSGTENMPGIAALGAVLAELEEGSSFRSCAQLEQAREKLIASLLRAFPDLMINTPLEQSLPTTLNVTVPGIDSGTLLDVFDAAGIRVSAGSACSAAKALPSYVLQAMGLPDWRSSNAVRISIGAATDDATIDAACSGIEQCAAALRMAFDNGADADGIVRNGAACLDAHLPHANAVTAPGGVANKVEPAGHTTKAQEQHAKVAPSLQIGAAALPDFLKQRVATIIVDVRDPVEHAVSRLPASLLGALNIPLSRLADAVPGWLALPEPPAILFFCRSGNRSTSAASLLRQLGYAPAFSLDGGLALAAPLLDASDKTYGETA
ncbi:aminotransferase class V-fold PLP-dependent enzyme [Janthinobacterium sp. PC23-8]|uniref:aminotransferase class V-fold PLP-dependent enzyme n=1 Tax=Janthinobacterium sp. PC23-8 TaxID=2012679 RepID=UPI000B961A11|nr:aminotransferase class V-fold PLP-dependent enzyme [Janthinobacterium sp. PC23-8]OYO31513.1 hypothetical protein CD932_10570 [Janthinobacterium sp. PC23-8]